MADLAHGGEPFDQVAQLHKSEAVFRQYRETAEFVHRHGLVGSLNGLSALEARFQLTVDRAHFLLALCNPHRLIHISHRAKGGAGREGRHEAYSAASA